MKTDLSKINLNLLIAFDALLKERHVTHAANSLNISQSAMSNILKQLRILFKDELFARGQASSMLPTARALELSHLVTEAIEQIKAVFQEQPGFNPKTAKQNFIIGMSDYAELVLLPYLVRFLVKNAPGVSLTIQHVNYLTDSRPFENDALDMSIGMYNKVPKELVSQTIFTDKFVFIGCKKNPLLKKPITGEDYAKSGQIIVLYYENRAQLISESYIRELGYERKVVATVPHTLAALYSLPNTDLICSVFERAAKKIIKILPLAIQAKSFKKCNKCGIEMVWHPKNRNNSVHRWLRETVINIAKNL